MKRLEIESERLLLSPVDGRRDFRYFSKLMSDEKTVQYMAGHPLSRVLVWRHVAMILGHWEIRGYGFFSLFEKETGQWIGRAGPWYPEGWYKPEIGWALLPEFCGNGFATEAASRCLDFVFDELAWSEVVHVIHNENIPSMKVAERIGSKKTSEVLGIPAITDAPCYVFSQQNPAKDDSLHQ